MYLGSFCLHDLKFEKLALQSHEASLRQAVQGVLQFLERWEKVIS